MSLVPDAVRNLMGLLFAFYAGLGNPKSGSSLNLRQIELVAGRVSALNECFLLNGRTREPAPGEQSRQ